MWATPVESYCAAHKVQLAGKSSAWDGHKARNQWKPNDVLWTCCVGIARQADAKRRARPRDSRLGAMCHRQATATPHLMCCRSPQASTVRGRGLGARAEVK